LSARRGSPGSLGRKGRRARPRPATTRERGAKTITATEPDSLRSVETVHDALAGERYLADRSLATAVFLAAAIEQPLLLEGEAGVGKTEVAKALAAATGARLIRLQCHEGIDVSQALYDWDYGRQLLALRAAELGVGAAAARDADTAAAPRVDATTAPRTASAGTELFSREFLLRRPLLEALEHPGPVVLLIDEVDRADDEFEAFLLELLSDFQVTIPELGTVVAARRPLVLLTSNRTRELHDALKRRCLYHWIEYPSREREAEIVRARLPGVPEAIAARVCDAVERLRGEELYKLPGVGETIAWARALLALGDEAELEGTLGVALKVREDVERVREAGVLAGV